jgi:L-threonylcarbamoyladenylate synthase
LRNAANLRPDHVRAGRLSFRTPLNADGYSAVEVLSPAGDLREAAANLFAALHRLDTLNLDLIVADLVPDTGLGLAINDRLGRAAWPKAEPHGSTE